MDVIGIPEVDALFTGPVQAVVPADTSRYDDKPEGNEDQGWRGES